MTRNRWCLFFITVAIVAGAWTGVAQRADCQGVGGNLLAANCGFDKDVTGWRGMGDTAIAHIPAAAKDPASASMKVTSSSQGSLTAVSACVAVRGATAYRFSARMRLSSGTPYFCAVNAWQYTDPGCADGAAPLGSGGGPPQSTWATIQGQASTSANAKSVHLRTDCSGQGVVATEWDDFVLAPTAAK